MYLVSYDITIDRVRNKIAEQLLNYGKRVQYSVFECDISSKQFEKMYAELAGLLQQDEDGSIRIYHLCKNCMAMIRVIGTDNKINGLTEEEAGLFIV